MLPEDLAPVRVIPTDKIQGRDRRGIRAQEDGREVGRSGHDRRPGRGYSVPLISAGLEHPASAGVKVDRESQSAAADPTSRPSSEQAKAEARRSSCSARRSRRRPALLPAAEVEGLYRRLLRHGRDLRLVAVHAYRAATSRRSASTSTTSRSRSRTSLPFEKQFGQTNSFGAPSWVAVQMIAMGIRNSCADGNDKPRRSSPRHRQGQDQDLDARRSRSRSTSGDVMGGVGFTIFQIGNDGSYSVVQKG